jgi:sulfonate transport system substrate-binding protein
VLSRANGNPIKGVYIYSRPEWTALVVPKDSPIKSVKDLKGRKVAATKGTDPYLFLLRSLHQEGLKKTDIEHASLQHADGRTALEQGKVDAWAGLDPLMAASELEAGSRLIYRNVSFNTYGFLNTTESSADSIRNTSSASSPPTRRLASGSWPTPRRRPRLVAEEAKLSAGSRQAAIDAQRLQQPGARRRAHQGPQRVLRRS